MTCPRCQATIDAEKELCPECGAGLYRNVSGIIRTSAVMISAGGKESFYHSVQEVPERLRKQLIDTTAGDNAGTIVIADRAGKEQLTQALARRELAAARPSPPIAELAAPQPGAETPQTASQPPMLARLPWLAWAGFAAVLAGAAAVSAFFGMHW